MKRLLCAALGFALLAASSPAAFHVMQIDEVIGSINGDPNAQAIELRMRSGGQTVVSNASLYAADASGGNRKLLLNIATNVSNGASGARVLLATSGFTSTMVAGGATSFTPDFTLDQPIPSAYLNAGRLTFEDDFGTVYWSIAWGGTSYTGGTTGSTTNDTDGNFGKLTLGLTSNSSSLAGGVIFTGTATAASTTNSSDYAYLSNPTTVTKNNGTAFTVVPEPGSAGLIAAGALFLGGFAIVRRRRS